MKSVDRRHSSNTKKKMIADIKLLVSTVIIWVMLMLVPIHSLPLPIDALTNIIVRKNKISVLMENPNLGEKIMPTNIILKSFFKYNFFV